VVLELFAVAGAGAAAPKMARETVPDAAAKWVAVAFTATAVTATTQERRAMAAGSGEGGGKGGKTGGGGGGVGKREHEEVCARLQSWCVCVLRMGSAEGWGPPPPLTSCSSTVTVVAVEAGAAHAPGGASVAAAAVGRRRWPPPPPPPPPPASATWPLSRRVECRVHDRSRLTLTIPVDHMVPRASPELYNPEYCVFAASFEPNTAQSK